MSPVLRYPPSSVRAQFGKTHRVGHSLPEPIRKKLGNQEREMTLRALLGKRDIRKVATRIEHRNSLGTHLRRKSCGVMDVSHHETALAVEIGAFVAFKVRIVQDR